MHLPFLTHFLPFLTLFFPYLTLFLPYLTHFLPLLILFLQFQTHLVAFLPTFSDSPLQMAADDRFLQSFATVMNNPQILGMMM